MSEDTIALAEAVVENYELKETNYDKSVSRYCIFCDGGDTYSLGTSRKLLMNKHINHTDSCEVLLARRILKNATAAA